MQSRTLICAFLFLALCALQLCRPNTAEAVRTCIEPAIAQDIPLRTDAEALGRAIAGGGDVQAVWARWMDERGSAAVRVSEQDAPADKTNAAAAFSRQIMAFITPMGNW